MIKHSDQQRLAKAAGVSHMSIWRLVTGRTRTRPKKWLAIKAAAERLGLSVPAPPAVQSRYALQYSDCLRVATWARISYPAVLRALQGGASARTRELVGDAMIALGLEPNPNP